MSASHAVKLAAHLTERDRSIALDCYEHHVLTTDQLKRLHFTGLRIDNRAPSTALQAACARPLPPYRETRRGVRPYHWILDEAGALIVADHKGIDRSQLHYTRDDALRLASKPQPHHHVEANEFFIRLAVDANRPVARYRSGTGSAQSLTFSLGSSCPIAGAY